MHAPHLSSVAPIEGALCSPRRMSKWTPPRTTPDKPAPCARSEGNHRMGNLVVVILAAAVAASWSE